MEQFNYVSVNKRFDLDETIIFVPQHPFFFISGQSLKVIEIVEEPIFMGSDFACRKDIVVKKVYLDNG